MVASSPRRSLTCWVVTDGKIGMEKQCLALAGAVCGDDDSIVVKRIAVKPPWRWLPPACWLAHLTVLDRQNGDALAPPWPDLVVATGRLSVVPALTVRRLARDEGSACTAVQIQNPGVMASRFDLVVAPAHDNVTGDNVLTTMGALHDVNAASLSVAAARFAPLVADLPRPLISVLLGGPNKVFKFSDGVAEKLGADLARLAANHNAGLAITASRRTPPAALAKIKDAVKDAPTVVWDGQGENPYTGFLALADAIVVTGDSVNMVSEAAGAGKPVYTVMLAGGSEKFAQFHETMESAGLTRPFSGKLDDWRTTPPDDITRAATAVRDLLQRVAMA